MQNNKKSKKAVYKKQKMFNNNPNITYRNKQDV